jgi:hypothetical protein
MIPSSSAERFESANLGLNIVSLDVDVHAFLRYLWIGRVLQEDADLTIGKPQSTVNMSARHGDRFLYRP